MIAAVLAGLLAAGALLLWMSPGAFGVRSRGPGRRRRAAGGSAPRRARPGPGDHSFPALPAAALVELTACQLDAGLPLAEAVGVLADSSAGRPYPALSRAAAALRLGLSWETAWPHEKTLPEYRRAERAAEALAVKLVLPLGLCFLPAFMCWGVVPVLMSLLPRAFGS